MEAFEKEVIVSAGAISVIIAITSFDTPVTCLVPEVPYPL